jgi:hypothetical protein
LQQPLTLSPLERLPRLLAFTEQAQDETIALALLQLESRDSTMARALFEWHHASEIQGRTCPSKDHPAPDELDGVLLAGVVEGRMTIDFDGHPTPYNSDVADQVVA